MSCCAPVSELALDLAADGRRPDEIRLASHIVADGIRQSDLSVPGIHCGGCIARIESALAGLPGVERARVNLSTRRVTIRWRAEGAPPPFFETLRDLGYEAHLHEASADRKDPAVSELVRALAVAGFAASNIMLLSVSVWSGADPATRDIFHWLSGAIALPTLVYSGRVFFRSAWGALRRGHTNMDVPISIGVLLAFGLSAYETFHHGAHAYFDASVTLLFFLLIGRALDHMMRERARVAVAGLAKLAARGALVRQPDGSNAYLGVEDIAPGMTILLAVGERVPVDAQVIEGRSELDCALVSGESLPRPVAAGAALQAGTLNLGAPLIIRATAAARDSFLAEMLRLMEAAESGRAGYRRIADRAARLYAPVVHSAAALTGLGWLLATGDLHLSLTIAISVLIITCPCALGLAVPMVQVVAAQRLFARGILLKDGGALERLAGVDALIFDKTGTLTRGEPQLIGPDLIAPAALAMAGAMAMHSRHPYSRAIAAASGGLGAVPVPPDALSEQPGYGLEARLASGTWRLGRPDWALRDAAHTPQESAGASVVLARDGAAEAAFRFEDRLREGAADAVAALRHAGLPLEIVSGDREAAVAHTAAALGDLPYTANATPEGKRARIAAIEAGGRKVLMIGDGLNDAPALVAAHASMAPASAADIGRNAADLVFLHESLAAVPLAIGIARAAGRLVRQNLALAVLYNLIAVPLAMLGYVTPLVAAIAMSGSSVLVVANALRLSGGPAVPAARPAASAPLRLAGGNA